jgi:hypothetical protein
MRISIDLLSAGNLGAISVQDIAAGVIGISVLTVIGLNIYFRVLLARMRAGHDAERARERGI